MTSRSRFQGQMTSRLSRSGGRLSRPWTGLVGLSTVVACSAALVGLGSAAASETHVLCDRTAEAEGLRVNLAFLEDIFEGVLAPVGPGADAGTEGPAEGAGGEGGARQRPLGSGCETDDRTGVDVEQGEVTIRLKNIDADPAVDVELSRLVPRIDAWN